MTDDLRPEGDVRGLADDVRQRALEVLENVRREGVERDRRARMAEFKFEIGQTVAHTEAAAQVEREKLSPPRLTILARITEECIGGIQRFYMVRLVSTGYGGGLFDSNLHRLHDFEVVAYPDLPVKFAEDVPQTPEQALAGATLALERATFRQQMAAKHLAELQQKAKDKG